MWSILASRPGIAGKGWKLSSGGVPRSPGAKENGLRQAPEPVVERWASVPDQKVIRSPICMMRRLLGRTPVTKPKLPLFRAPFGSRKVGVLVKS